MKTKKSTALSGTASHELVPLTDHLYTDFSIEVLEERLETDPLLLSGLFDQITPFCVACKSSDLGCFCDGIYEPACRTDIDVDCFKM